LGNDLNNQNSILFGIKISTESLDYYKEIKQNSDIIDFIEITLKPNFNEKDLERIRIFEFPLIFHLANSNDNINFGEKKKQIMNQEYILKINNYIDSFREINPLCYIVHPESGNIDLSIRNIKNLMIAPLAIENMPVKGIYGGELLGYSTKTIKIFFQKIQNLELCLDINHAIKASISLEVDSFKFLREFIQFRTPRIFHIAGGDSATEIDNHLHLNEGNYDLNQIISILKKIKDPIYLTFETPRYLKGINEDLYNMQYFKMRLL